MVLLQSSDRETIEIIGGGFIETWQRNIQRLREGLEQGDVAHSFKGSLASFAAEPAIQVVGDLERRALVPHLKIVVFSVSG